MPLTASMQGEQRVISGQQNPPHTDDQHASPSDQTSDDTPTSSNANTDHLGPNFETPDPQPPLRCSTCQRFESEYFRQLCEGEGSVDSKQSRETTPTAALTEVLHGGRNQGESPDDDDIVYAMVARVSKAEGLDPSMIDEARARPDWAKWDEAISKELASLEAVL